MNVLKYRWARAAVLVAGAAALLAGGCDDAGEAGWDAAVSRNVAGGVGVSPNLAGDTGTDWPSDAPGDETASTDAEDGRQLYLGSCAACHGTGGQGMPNQGPDLRGSAFVAGSTDDHLLAFLAGGRPATDPQNKSRLPMPPRGGNPSLSDRHLGQIVKYLRTVAPPEDAAQVGSAAEVGNTEGRP